MKKTVIVAIVLIAVVFSASMVFNVFTKKHEKQKIRVGYIPVTHCIPLYIAFEDRLFSDAGLDIELVPLPGGPKILEALAACDIQIGFSNVVSVIIAHSQGIPIVPVTGGPVETQNHRDHALMVSVNSSIQSGVDLKGKKLAINSRRNIDHLMITLYLKKMGFDQNEVTLVEVPFPRMEATITSGSVDAVATAEPFITLGLHHKTLRIIDWNYVAVRPKTFVSTFAVTEDFLRSNRNIVETFVQVIGRASQIANNDPNRARASLISFTKITEEVAAKVGLPFFTPHIDVENVAETEKLLLETGLLSHPVNIKSLLKY